MRGHARAARERRREYERRERTGELAKISNMSSSTVDILHINESKLDSTVRDNEVHIPGFDTSEKIVESPREKGEGGWAGGYSIKLCSERLCPEVLSLTLIYTIWQKVLLSCIFH